MRISLRKFDRAGNAAATATSKARKGFVLVEVIVAMVLLAVAVTSLAALMYSVSQSGMKATGNAYRNGVLMQEVNRLEGIPYDSVTVGTTAFGQHWRLRAYATGYRRRANRQRGEDGASRHHPP